MDIWEHVLGFMDAQIIMTAEELGVFRALSNGCCCTKCIASKTGLPEDSADRILTMLAALELIKRKVDGSYKISDEAAQQLVKGKPGYIGAMFHHLKNDVYPLWQYSKEALLEGKAQWELVSGGKMVNNKRIYEDAYALRKFMEGMHTITFTAADEFASNAPELHEISNLIDIGGASGAFLIALAKRFPNLQGVVFDLPPVQPITEDFIRKEKLGGRLEFKAGNFWHEPIPAGADAYSLGFILHDWSTDEGSMLLDKIAQVSKKGGWLIIGEFLLNDNKTGPLWAARSNLNMLIAAKGRERSAAEYNYWLKEFGFELQQICSTSTGKNFLIFRFQGKH